MYRILNNGSRFTSRRHAPTQVLGVVKAICRLQGKADDGQLRKKLGALSSPELQAMYRDLL